MRIVGGDRAAQYGDQRVNFAKYASTCTTMLDDQEREFMAHGVISDTIIVKALMAVKIGRHAFKPKRDNIVDLCGYASILNHLQETECTP